MNEIKNSHIREIYFDVNVTQKTNIQLGTLVKTHIIFRNKQIFPEGKFFIAK